MCAPFPTTGFVLSMVFILSPFVELVYKINITGRDIRFPFFANRGEQVFGLYG